MLILYSATLLNLLILTAFGGVFQYFYMKKGIIYNQLTLPIPFILNTLYFFALPDFSDWDFLYSVE
jgi:hypothetical protein